jgi:hypothetical protein
MIGGIKRLLLPQGRRLRRIIGGIGAGSWMSLDLQDQFQRFLGLDERELAQTVNRLVARSQTLVDVGANDGLYTLHFLASPAVRIIACEAGTISAQLLVNAAANGHEPSPRFVVEHRLIGHREGAARLAQLPGNAPGPIFIKVDVDGMEEEVLRSCEGFDRLSEVAWLVETHSLELEQRCTAWFIQHSYNPTIVRPAWWRKLIPERRPLEHNQWLVAEQRI